MPKFLKLGLTLMIFCAVSAGLLAAVFLLTDPIIKLNAKLVYENSVKEVLPAAGKAVEVSPRGYAGPVRMLVGVSLDGKVIGLKIIEQKETPGLGSNITSRKFLGQFIGKTINDPIQPKQDIDAITGATISSRAVCNGVREGLRRFAE